MILFAEAGPDVDVIRVGEELKTGKSASIDFFRKRKNFFSPVLLILVSILALFSVNRYIPLNADEFITYVPLGCFLHPESNINFLCSFYDASRICYVDGLSVDLSVRIIPDSSTFVEGLISKNYPEFFDFYHPCISSIFISPSDISLRI